MCGQIDYFEYNEEEKMSSSRVPVNSRLIKKRREVDSQRNIKKLIFTNKSVDLNDSE